MENKCKHPIIKIKLFTDEAKGYVQILDNAGGIDAKIIEKVFEPYFTTKEHNGGTGLGLYISKMIIEKNMGGSLSITNTEGGSEVLITLTKEKDASVT